MQVFDASAIIHAWDHYPLGQFPPVWAWMGGRIKAGQFGISEVANGEVKQRAPDCHDWCRRRQIRCVPITATGLEKAAEIKRHLRIVNDRYNPVGVGENDILIIASACVEGHELVSNENRQNDLPKNPAKYKIPAVCDLHMIEVPCISFLDLIKQSGVVFDGS